MAYSKTTAIGIALALTVLTGCPRYEEAESTPRDGRVAHPAGEGEVMGTLSYAIADTGQRDCYDDTGPMVCAADGAFAGQDAQYAGHEPSYVDHGDGTVTDQVTGLMWAQAHSGKMGWLDALDQAYAFDAGGHTDWRLPTVKELYSLIQFDGATAMTAAQSLPYLDTGVFAFDYGDESAGERMIDAQYWTRTEYVSTTMGGQHTVFGVNFADGRIKGYPTVDPRSGGDTFHFVRFVRGNPEYGINAFGPAADGVVSDAATGLDWQQDDAGEPLDWADALAYCEALEVGGHDDWRLPDAKALQSLVDYTRAPSVTHSAAIDPRFGVSDVQSMYWTSTTHCDGPPDQWGQYAVYVAFGQAFGFMQGPGEAGAVRMDVHGAGAQRSDPKSGDPADWAGGHGPQGDEVRIFNAVRCVRGGARFEVERAGGEVDEAGASAGAPDPAAGGLPAPPAQAVVACAGASEGMACAFDAPMGPVSGTCLAIQGALACAPPGAPGR